MKKNIKSTLKKIYINYFVKTPMVYFASIFVFLIVILIMMISVKIEITETYSGSMTEDKIVINELVEHQISDIYVYKNNEEKKYFFVVSGEEKVEQFTLIYFDSNNNDKTLNGNVKVDIVIRRVSLLSIVLGFDKKNQSYN